jgi:hypothetical protein
MKPLAVIIALSICACAPSASAPTTVADQPITVGNLVVTPLGSGVYAAIRTEPLASR